MRRLEHLSEEFIHLIDGKESPEEHVLLGEDTSVELV